MVQNRDLDIIDVGTQPALRYDMAMAALDAGKHVYNCLPFAVDTQKAEAMRDLQKGKGVVGVVDAQFRWVPAIRRLKEMIAEGRLGDFSDRCGWLFPGSAWQPRPLRRTRSQLRRCADGDALLRRQPAG